MLYLIDCGIGNIVELYATSCLTSLASYTQKTNTVITATYLGYYPDSTDSGDQCLVGWKVMPTLKDLIDARVEGIPKSFTKEPQVSDALDYKYFRWCGKGRYAHQDLGAGGLRSVPSGGLKPGELSPIHAPGWHQCRCGFRNQDISITAIIAGKYVCYQCRNIWKK